MQATHILVTAVLLGSTVTAADAFAAPLLSGVPCGCCHYNSLIPLIIVAIVSTSKGVMTDRAARNAGMGGEIIGYVA